MTAVEQAPNQWEEVRAEAVRQVREAGQANGIYMTDELAAALTDAVLGVCDEEATRQLGEQYVADSRVRALRAEDGAAVLETVVAREAAAHWVMAARALLEGAENYSETSMEFADRPRGERYAFTVQRVGRHTPHELRRAAEAERDELRARLAELEAAGGR